MELTREEKTEGAAWLRSMAKAWLRSADQDLKRRTSTAGLPGMALDVLQKAEASHLKASRQADYMTAAAVALEAPDQEAAQALLEFCREAKPEHAGPPVHIGYCSQGRLLGTVVPGGTDKAVLVLFRREDPDPDPLRDQMEKEGLHN